ncbi:cytochrome P450 [Microbulbifer sp. 2205BS26-8]|uniref:cytochrome P450 n=1 Tax=Microbulbifer sp. 2205BS26-8 TaxID=3064386 RepID=UPI00273FCBEF|nr:cytochrome P450 [Microbulbifer sp. 2205BS26-8]MDP5209286.1 cytochrome P450 [Microbulbifer sp. 2205BS26-8]
MTDSSMRLYASNSEPPLVKGLPIVGNTLQMAKNGGPGPFFYKCYREHGPIFRVKVLNKTYKVLAGPEAVEFMGSKEGKKKLRSKEFWQQMKDAYQAKYQLTAESGEIHARLRAVMREGYSRKILIGKFDQFLQATDDMLKLDWQVGHSVPVVSAMQRLVTGQLGLFLTGRVPLNYVEDIRITIKTILNVLVTRQRPRILLYAPRYRRAFKRVHELGESMIKDYYVNKRKKANQEKNLIDDIMEEHERNSDLIPESDLILTLTGPYVAGLDTVANTTANLIYLVLKHPDVYQKVQQEVDAVFANPNLDTSCLKELPTLSGAIMESLRMYPVTAAAMRAANIDFNFAGYEIKEGELLYMGITVPHLMEEFYPEPEKFDVERYNKGRGEHLQANAFSPYGRGPHTCLGRSLAEVQMVLSMARLFYRLDLQLDPFDYALKIKVAPTPGPERGFKVKVKGIRNKIKYGIN